MLSQLLGLIPFKAKIWLGIAIFVAITVVGGTIKHLYASREEAKTKLTVSETLRETEYTTFTEERRNFKVQIDKLNDTIKELELKKEAYEDTVRLKDDKLLQADATKQAIIVKEIQRDSSCENRYNIISDIMRDVHNAIK